MSIREKLERAKNTMGRATTALGNGLNSALDGMGRAVDKVGKGVERAGNRFGNWAFGKASSDGRDAQTCMLEAQRIVLILRDLRIRETFSLSGLAHNALANFDIPTSDLKDLFQRAIHNKVTDWFAKAAADRWTRIRDWFAHKKAGLIQQVRAQVGPGPEWPRRLRAWIQEKVDLVVNAYRGSLLNRLASNEHVKGASREVADVLTFAAGQIASLIAQTVADSAPVVGYVGDGLSIYQGVRTAYTNSKHLHHMRKVRSQDVLSGAPDLVITSLERHYAVRIASGVTTGLKGGTSLGLRIVADSVAAGAVVGAVISSLDFALHLIDRIIERILLRVALRQTRKDPNLTKIASWDGTTAPSSTDYETFTNWFRSWLVVSPVLSAVVLCAYPEDKVSQFIYGIDASADSASVKRLGKHAKRFLQQHHDEYSLRFSGKSDPNVKSRLENAY